MNDVLVVEEIGEQKQAIRKIMSLQAGDIDAQRKAIDANAMAKKTLDKVRSYVKTVKDPGERAVLEEMIKDLVLTRKEMLARFLGITEEKT